MPSKYRKIPRWTIAEGTGYVSQTTFARAVCPTVFNRLVVMWPGSLEGRTPEAKPVAKKTVKSRRCGSHCDCDAFWSGAYFYLLLGEHITAQKPPQPERATLWLGVLATRVNARPSTVSDLR